MVVKPGGLTAFLMIKDGCRERWHGPQVGSEDWRAQCREDVLIALGGATVELVDDLVVQHKLLGVLPTWPPM